MQDPTVDGLTIELFADGADIDSIRALASNPLIAGFTTNPTLLRKAGVQNYEAFGRELLSVIPDRPVSFEVFADESAEIEQQALKLASWGDNVYVKIPVTTTDGASTAPTVRRLADAGVQLNVTALMTDAQVAEVVPALAGGPACNLSVFAGRVADTGRDPIPMMESSLEHLQGHENIKLIWASPRELLNLFQADSIGCHIITMTHDLLAKLPGVGKDLDQFSLETVKMFFDDAGSSGYSL
ncbi:transaldolase [soil metagenome]